MPSTSGMKGEGFYDANSSGQRAAVEALLPWVDDAAARLALPSAGRPLVIADYGSSEGRNALSSMRQAINALRSRGFSDAVCTVFSDLSTNNFNQLFHNLSADGAFANASQVYHAVIGGSFYNQLLPPQAVHLATSFNSVLWLDHLPKTPLVEFVVYLGPRAHRSDIRVPSAVAEAFATQAKHDIEQFFRRRAAELAPGARLLVAQPGRDETYCTGQGLYDLLHDSCLDLIATGRLDRAGYAQVTMPIYFRNQRELVGPLDSQRGALRDEFSIERAETHEITVPFAADFQRTGDLATYADRYVRFAQAFTEPILRAGLDTGPDDDTVPAIYRRMQERLQADPQKYAFRYVQTAVLVARK